MTTMMAIIAAIGGALSAGGLASKFLDWLGTRTTSKTTIDAKTIDADLTVNGRLLTRMGELEKRYDDAVDEHAAELRARDDRIASLAAERDRLGRRELELMGQLASLTRQHETTREDMLELRRHADRLEAENRKMKDASVRVRRPT